MRSSAAAFRLVTLLLALLIVGGSATSASADNEPNNGIAEAEGPVSGGVNYTGTIDTTNDIDTYMFYVSGEVPLSVHVSNASSNCVTATLGDTNNATLQGASLLKMGESAELTYTTAAGVNRFYLQFEGCYEDTGQYSFSIAPSSAIVSGAATLAQNAVPGLHEYPGQAFGPLAANTAYTDTLLTSNDENWLTFFTPLAQETVDVEATLLTGGECGGASLSVGKTYVPLTWDRWSHETFTSPGSAQYFVSTEKCMGMSWEAIVKTAALAPGLQTQSTPPPPPPPPPPAPSNACLHDRANLAKAQLLVRRYRHELGSHRLSRKARHRLRRGLAHATALVRHDAALRRRQCPGGR
jgi:hypothetical protein